MLVNMARILSNGVILVQGKGFYQFSSFISIIIHISMHVNEDTILSNGVILVQGKGFPQFSSLIALSSSVLH